MVSLFLISRLPFKVVSPVMVAPLLIIKVLENVVDAANVAAALTVKLSAAASPIAVSYTHLTLPTTPYV